MPRAEAIAGRRFSVLRATWLFAAAYVVVSTAAFGIYLVVAAIMGQSPWDEVAVKDNVAYQRVVIFLPLINLAIWTVAARLYFTGSRRSHPAWPLALWWVLIAVILDYVVFVLPDHSLAVDPAGFYLGQGPWIYLTYAAVAASTFLGRGWAQITDRRRPGSVPREATE